MGKIFLKNMRFYGYHGVLEEENKLGQEYQVDIELSVDLDKAVRTDDIKHSVDYSKVFDITKKIVENDKFNLIEALAGKIIENVKSEFAEAIKEIVVTIRKPSAPINGIFDYAAVEVRG